MASAETILQYYNNPSSNANHSILFTCGFLVWLNPAAILDGFRYLKHDLTVE